MAFDGRKSLLLCVTGGIAAYKSCEIARHFVKLDVDVTALLTQNGARFVSPLTFESLTNRPCFAEMFKGKDATEVGGAYKHIDLGQDFDAMLVAPATANTIAKFASGIADDLLSTTYLCAEREVIVAPAMNTRMWNHPATQRNLARLEADGARIIAPGAGDLACGETGPGRLADVPVICAIVEGALGRGCRLAGKKIVVTTGATRESLDPIRFVSNNSTGDFGRAVARQLVHYGSEVTLIEANPPSPFEIDCRRLRADSAAAMLAATTETARNSDCVFMLSAVADFAAASPAVQKIKKSESDKLVIELERTADVLSELSALENRPMLVGVSAETGDVVENSAAKIKAKKLAAILAVRVGEDNRPFGASPLGGTILKADGTSVELAQADKGLIARRFVDAVFSPEEGGF